MADEDYESEESSGGTYTETSEKGWLERMGESIKNVAIGLVLFFGSFGLLWWNEGKAVRTAAGLERVAGQVVTIQADKVDPANEGKPVTVSGDAVTSEKLKDSLGFEANTFKMTRKVEMYQWSQESKDKKERKGTKDVTTTTYSYKKGWSSSQINSDDFKQDFKRKEEKKLNETIKNPPFAYQEEKINAKVATLGAFTLSESIIKRVANETEVKLSQEDYNKLSGEIKGRAKLNQGGLYIGKDPANPQIGDIKITYSKTEPKSTVTLRMKQTGSGFTPFVDKAVTIDEVTQGIKTAEEMNKTAVESNEFMTWIWRLVGFLCMAIGLNMVLKPLATLLDVIPILGDLLSAGLGIVSGFIALILSVLTIAIAWIAHRPWLLGVLAVIIVGGYFGIKQLKKSKAEVPAKA